MAKEFAFRITPEERQQLESRVYFEHQEEPVDPGYEEWVLEGLKEAIAEADAGEFATEEEVQAIFRKYMDPHEN